MGYRGKRSGAPLVTLEQWAQEVAELGIGWLGWSEQETLHADVNAILVGFEGRCKMLKYAGMQNFIAAHPPRSTSQVPPRLAAAAARTPVVERHEGPKQPLTVARFDSLFG